MALPAAHTLQLAWCIPHVALESSQLIHQIFCLQVEDRRGWGEDDTYLEAFYTFCEQKSIPASTAPVRNCVPVSEKKTNTGMFVDFGVFGV